MRNVFLGVFFKKLSIVTADLDERRASEPKQTTFALADSSSHCVVHSKKSHATDFLIVKFGWPAASMDTVAVPVSWQSSCWRYAVLRPSSCIARHASLPRSSSPTRLATMP